MNKLVPILLASCVGFCNIPFVYGLRKAHSDNPFIFAASFCLIAGVMLLAVSLLYGRLETAFFTTHWHLIVLAALGIVFINFLAYLVINRYGASYWMIASLSAMLIPALVVGYWIFREELNLWIVPAVVSAVMTVVFFTLSKK